MKIKKFIRKKESCRMLCLMICLLLVLGCAFYSLAFKGETFQSINQNVFVYATSKKVTVKFNANGGKASKKIKRLLIKKKIGKLPTATRSGYKFKGWYTKKNGGKKYTSKTKVTKKKLTLYAQWKKQQLIQPRYMSIALPTFPYNLGKVNYFDVIITNYKWSSNGYYDQLILTINNTGVVSATFSFTAQLYNSSNTLIATKNIYISKLAPKTSGIYTVNLYDSDYENGGISKIVFVK